MGHSARPHVVVQLQQGQLHEKQQDAHQCSTNEYRRQLCWGE